MLFDPWVGVADRTARFARFSLRHRAGRAHTLDREHEVRAGVSICVPKAASAWLAADAIGAATQSAWLVRRTRPGEGQIGHRCALSQGIWTPFRVCWRPRGRALRKRAACSMRSAHCARPDEPAAAMDSSRARPSALQPPRLGTARSARHEEAALHVARLVFNVFGGHSHLAWCLWRGGRGAPRST